MKIRALKAEHETVDLMLREAIEKHGQVKRGIIVVFEDDGTMHTFFHANSQELAMAACRLSQLAAE